MKLTRHLFIIFILFQSGVLLAQSPPFSWAKTVTGSNYETYNEMVIDSAGNIFTIGSYADSLDLTPGTAGNEHFSNGFSDFFITKYDASGNFIWGQSYGGIGYDYAGGIGLDEHNNIIITGYFNDTVDFDYGPGNSISTSVHSNLFVLKLNENGSFIWVRSPQGTSWTYGYDVVLDNKGNIYSCGYFGGGKDFDPGVGSFQMTATLMAQPSGNYGSSGDYFIQKLDSNGNFLWAISGEDTLSYSPGYFSRRGNDLALDPNGNVYLSGHFYKSCDFKPGPGNVTLTSNSQSDFFLLSVDSLGSFNWVKSYGGIGNEWYSVVECDDNGGVYFSGAFNDTVDFNPGANSQQRVSNGSTDMIILKLDTAGIYQWAYSFGGPSFDQVNDIAVDDFGFIYFTGEFNGTVDFDPGSGVTQLSSSTPLYSEFFMLKLNANGGMEWVDNLDSQSGRFNPTSVAISSFNEIYCGGMFELTIDANMGSSQEILTSTAIPNEWTGLLFKLHDCLPTTDTISQSVCSNYTSPSGLHTWYTTGIYSDTLLNSTGCDSLISIDLTVGTIDTVMIVSCDSFTIPYSNSPIVTSGVYFDTLSSKFECDSVIRYHITLYHSIFDTVNITSCDSFVNPLNNQVWHSTGTYYDSLSTVNGCDSITKVNVFINNSSTTIIDTTVCDFYISPISSTTWNSSGSYFESTTNSSGCDSSVTVNLIVSAMDTSISLIYDNTIAIDSAILWSNATGNVNYQWINCDSSNSIVGATNQYFVPEHSGSYAVEISNGLCVKTSPCYSIKGVGITENTEHFNISIFPNPMRNDLHIQQEKLQYVEIQILDLTGKVLITTSGISDNFSINVRNLANGLYLLQVKSETQTRIQKVVKN